VRCLLREGSLSGDSRRGVGVVEMRLLLREGRRGQVSVMTYTCAYCGDTGRGVLDVIEGENTCELCKEEGDV
jgi:hypothetical protein